MTQIPSRRALLVYPHFPDTYWSFRHAIAFQGKRSAFPPLGLLTIAAMFPANWELRLVDMNVQRLTDADVRWADVVFASAMIVQKDSLNEVIARARKSGKRVVVGGPYVTTTADVFDADHVFYGEAERTLPEFFRDLEAGEARRDYRDPERPDLTTTPVPLFHLAELSRYSAMSVQYSRGCPFNCEFCDIIEIYGRVPRTKSNAQVLAELDALAKTGWRGNVFIVDDNFIGNKKNVRKLLPELAQWSEDAGRPFAYITEASVNLAEDDALLADMQRAGFSRVFLGIETPVEESLIEAQKKQNTRRNLIESVQAIQHYGIEVMAGFIVGFDSDPDDIFERQIRFIRESAIPLAMVGLLTALPDTQLWRRLAQEGRLVAESTGNNTDGSLNFIPKMDRARLIEGYRQILHTIYSPAEFYKRALDCLGRTQQPQGESRHTTIAEDVSAFLRVVYALGVRDVERATFWRYLGKVVLEHRDRFSHAVTLAAMGYHFRKVTWDE